MNFLWKLIGGGAKTYSEEDCRAWLSNKEVNPQTGRKIGPTASGKGIYHDLEKACLEQGIAPEKPKPVVPKALRKTVEGEAIVRSTGGRKAPAVSATSVSVGTKMVGQDGQMYIVKLRANGTQYWQSCVQKTAAC